MPEQIISLNDDKYMMQIVSATFVGVESGVGSLNTLLFNTNEDFKIALWLFLSDWAFVYEENEIAASDDLNIGATLNLDAHIGSSIDNIFIFLPSKEIHFEFSNGLRLEIWANDDAYGSGSGEYFLVFSRNKPLKHLFTYPEDFNFRN